MFTSDFILHFSELEDPRITNHNSKHNFQDIFILAFIANLCSCDSWVEVESFCKVKIDFFKQFLDLPNGIPSHDTFGRVFSLIDSYHLEELLISWMNKVFNKSRGEVVAIDGKTIRAARRKGESKGIHLVNAWACDNKLSLGVMKVESKSNEITAITKLLKVLNIANCTVTIDAMGCQKSIAKEIVKNSANYILCVKDNQKRLKDDLELSFKLHEKDFYQHSNENKTQNEKCHGRVETRRYITLPIEYSPHLKDDWAEIKSIVKVIRTRTIDSETAEQVNYYISSHSYLSEQIEKGIRKHWNIENCLHWQLDISFDEDRCRARTKNEAENIAILRRISMAFLKKDKKSKVGIKIKRRKASWDNTYLLNVLNEGLKSETEDDESV
jgi:predicted transposase YbfD/YdcC